MRSRLHSCTVLAAMAGLAVVGCKGDKENADTGDGTLPPDAGASSDNPDTGYGYEIEDTGPTGDTGLNEEPPFILDIVHDGAWELVPVGGPYTSMTGSLVISEIVQGSKGDTVCSVEYSLTGDVADEACDHCTEAFDVNFYVVTEGWEDDEGYPVGGIADCQFPDLPEDGDTWRMGYADVDKEIFFDFYGSGIWVAWYNADQVHDDVTYGLDAEVGFVPVEEDE